MTQFETTQPYLCHECGKYYELTASEAKYYTNNTNKTHDDMTRCTPCIDYKKEVRSSRKY